MAEKFEKLNFSFTKSKRKQWDRVALIAELQKLPSDRKLKISGDYAVICCPSHKGGSEQNPSMTVKLTGRWAGYCKCFACNLKGPVEDILKLTFAPVEFATPVFSKNTRVDLLGFSNEIPLNSSLWPKDVEWRGIEGKTLNKIGARYAWISEIKENRLWLPCYQKKDKLVGSIAADIEGTAKKKYINSHGPGIQKSLFLIEHIQANDAIVIVEGPRDALFLFQQGIPAVALLGATNWSEGRTNLLKELNPRLIILALDGDKAGQKGTKRIYDILKKANFKIKALRLRSDADPVTLTASEIKALKKLTLLNRK